jgi:hypothetical protein
VSADPNERRALKVVFPPAATDEQIEIAKGIIPDEVNWLFGGSEGVAIHDTTHVLQLPQETTP